MSTNYILSQIAVVIAYIFFAITYKVKDRKTILIIEYGYLFFSALSLLLLSAYTGFAMEVIAMLRNLLFLFQNKTEKSKYSLLDYFILVLFMLICIVSSIFTYNGIFSLLSTASTMLYTFSLWQRNIVVYKVLGIPVCLLFLLYNVYVMSIFGIICESIFFVVIIVENVMFFRKRKSDKLNNQSVDTPITLERIETTQI